ncbi:MAG TPA: MerR family transcriptional regulator [Actinomycetota bacterium]|nr:MerR family transcriptional regulator [Actinomycetota bacterium]
MSIGDVLKSLREEFPEVTVSKIRFLEAEGLIEPERTPSGYRKFYQQDLARLRYILRLQRDNFMPLKIIRRKLEQFEADGAEAPAAPAPARADSTGTDASGTPAPSTVPYAPEDDLDTPVGGLHLSLDELAAASGLATEQLKELQEYGLIDAHPLEGSVFYDEDDLMIAKIARDFAKVGIEPRHLRMYRHFAEREAGLFEQAVVPRGGSNDSRRRAVQSLSDLAKLSSRLKGLLLRSTLRQHLQR